MSKSSKYNLMLIVLVYLLCFIGLVFIYSASNYNASKNYGDSFLFVKKQLFGLIVGSIFLFVMFKFDYHKLIKLRWYILIASLVLLMLVFVPFLSVSANGANRWISLFGISIQASEIAKFGFVIFSSIYISKNYNKMKTLKGFLPVVLVGGGMCLLILLEPNLSVTLCLGMVMLLMLLVGGISFKWFMLLLIPALCLVPVLIIIEPYRFQRLIAFVNPWANPLEEGYQLIQSLYSLGAGGLFGVGLFNSRQKYLFLPFSESDFIFSIIGEETGLVGCIVLFLIYLAVISLGLKIALNSKDRLGAYMTFGIVSVIFCQLLINLCVCTGLIPPTGIPLPFISAGGSSLVVFLGAIGILLNISKQSILSENSSDLKFKIFNFIKKKSKQSVNP